MGDQALASVRGFQVPGGPPLDLSIHPGEVVRVVGPNGSGKTSLLRRLAGLEAPLPADRVHTGAASLVPQEAMDALIGLTVAGEFRLRRRDLPPGLRPLRHRDVATLSAGEARQVALATPDPTHRLLLLDEPAEGLDAQHQEALVRLVEAWTGHGAVVLVDHGACALPVTRTVDLGGSLARPWDPIEAPAHGARLDAEGTRIRRANVTLHVPAVHLGPGLHALTGPNGSGKTTLLRHLMGLDLQPADVGRHPESRRMLPARSLDVLQEDRVGACLMDAETWVTDALVPPHLVDRHPLHLSGGEARRVALARVLGTTAGVYLLDEPEAYLDEAARAALHGVLARRIAAGACVVCATHDSTLVSSTHSVITLGGS